MPTPISALRRHLDDVMRMFGEPVPLKGVLLLPEDERIEPIPVRFLSGPKLSSTERAVIDAIRREGEPLQQKELATAADLGIRTVQKITAAMVRRGLLVHHPTLGFYLPGMDVEDEA